MYSQKDFDFEHNSYGQMVHDFTIDRVADNLRKKGLNVRTNRGSYKSNVIKHKNTSISPDIYILKNQRVMNIYEVETNESVDSQPVEKWKLYSEGCRSFYLIVPEDRLKKSKKLASKHKIKVKDFITYNINR